MTSQRWPSVFLCGLAALCFISFAADRIHAEDAGNDIVIVPASIERDMLPELDIAAPEAHAVYAPTAPVSAPQAQQAAVSVEVVKRTWWDDLWGVLLPLLAAGGTYLGIWLYVQGRRLLASNAVRDADEKRKSDERGQAGVGLLASMVVLALVPLLLSSSVGCASLTGPREVEATRSIDVRVKRGPPCDIRLVADDEQVCRVYSETERCDVQIGPESTP